MKRLISLILAAIMLVAALASCAGTPTASYKSNIRLTSSDAADAAAWLTERLGNKLTDRIVLGTDADGYGVDVSTLESDGYFIRALDSEVALFARTTDGLDRAVRKYAKTVEAGSSAEDVTYHEGYRVKRIEIAGRDISEYTVYYEDDKYMTAAATLFTSKIAEACGAELAVSTSDPAEPYISIRYAHDEELGLVGFRWSVTDEGLTLECSDDYKAESPSVAVVRFLVNVLDWFGLDFGNEDLTPADLIEIKTGESGSEKPYFDWVNPGALYGGAYIENRRFDLGPRMVANSGIEVNGFGRDLSHEKTDNGWAWIMHQPCWMDEDFYEAARDDIIEYIERNLAAGKQIGVDFFAVDIAQADNNRWCDCRDCLNVLKAEGARSGVYLTWANRVSEELKELYPGLVYMVFAYDDTKKPPKTIVPNDNLFVTFASDHACNTHPMDGESCTTFDNWGKGFDTPTLTGYIKEWSKLTDKLGVWYYASSDGLASMSVLHTVRSDMKLLYDIGVRQVYWENKSNPYDTNLISQWLSYQMYWDVNMSEERFDELYDRILRIQFGDAAESVKYYITLYDSSYKYGPCRHAWNGFADVPPENAAPFNRDALAKTFDTMFETLEAAIPLADSEKQEAHVIKLQCTDIFTGCLSAYPKAKEAGDTERMKTLEDRYALIEARLRKYGVNMEKGIPDNVTKIYHSKLADYFPG